MNQATVLAYHQLLEMCKAQTLKTCQEVKPEFHLHQLKEGKGHPLWLLRHLANNLDVVGNFWTYGEGPVLAKKYGMKFAPDFAGGDPITNNPDDYPSWETLMEDYASIFDSFLERVKKTSDEELQEAPRGPVPEGMSDFFSSIGNDLRIMVLHDTHHRGQISMIAKLDG